MKKIFAILLSMLLVLSLAACSGGSEEATAESGNAQPAADPNQFGGDLLAKIQAQQSGEGSGGKGWQEVDESEGFGPYRTRKSCWRFWRAATFPPMRSPLRRPQNLW